MAKIRITFIAILFLLMGSIAHSAPLKDLPGGISLEEEQQAASDLIFQGKKLQPDEVRALTGSGRIKDLATLNPEEDSILWKDQFPKEAPNDLAALELNRENDEVEFIANDNAPNGRVIFLAQKRFADGRIKAYRFILDDKGHNMLVRKALLRKIGYNVPPMEHVKSIRVKFKGAFSKRQFLSTYVKRQMFKDGLRWVTSDPETEDEYLTFQDLIVLADTTDWYYNLARGNILPGVIQGRRLINSMLIPFTLTDAPESLNLMSWTGAQVFNTQALFPYEYSELFDPSLDDARWIMRRMMKLTDKDWQEIVDAGQMPLEPQLVFLEKLKARMNYAREILGLKREGKDLPVNMKVNSGERLVDGKLKGRQWPGYARWFAGEDPESPASFEELWSLFKSKFYTNVIRNTVTEFNTRYAPRTDIGFKVFDHQIDVAAKQFAEFLTTGKVTKTPLGVWKTPFYNTQIIAAREIVTGSYLGTDNRIQLADTLGFAVEGGMFYLGEGLPDRMTASARAKVTVVMTYTHIKPYNSIKASLKEPLSNIIIPSLKAQAVEPLEKMLAIEKRIRDKEFEGKNEEETKEKKDKLNLEYKGLFEELAKSLGSGESYIMYASLAPALQLTVGKGLSKDAQAYLEFQDKLTGIYRVHIFRKDEKAVHVYVDWAGYNELSASLGVRAKVNILELGFNWPKGKARTYFFSFNLDQDLERNPKFFEDVTGTLAAIRGSTRSFLSTIKTPWRFDHDFSDFRLRLDFLVWKNAKANTTNEIEARHPDGPSTKYIRRTRAQRTGREYEGLLLEVTNAIIAEKFPDSNLRVNTTTSGNPGDTIFGKSVTRQVIAEARNIPGPIDLDNVFAGVGYRWKGWESKIAGIHEILDDVDKRFGEKMFARSNLHDTKKVQFYSVEIQTALYRRAFERILRLTDDQVNDLFKRYGRQAIVVGENGSTDQVHPWATWILKDMKRMRLAYTMNDTNSFADYLVDVVEVAESQLEFEGFKEFIGGKDNLFVQGSLKGFRLNSEGQEDIRPINLGQVGGREPLGPIYTLQKEIGISGGELLLHWLVNPL